MDKVSSQCSGVMHPSTIEALQTQGQDPGIRNEQPCMHCVHEMDSDGRMAQVAAHHLEKQSGMPSWLIELNSYQKDKNLRLLVL